MSFTLRLGARGGNSLDPSAVAKWAANQPHFTADLKRYRNETTGAYFTLSFEAGQLLVDINYNRPSFFGAEAIEALAPLCRDLELTVSDAQGVATPSAFDAEALLASYINGNRYARDALAAVKVERPAVMARADAMALWRYRKVKDRLVDELQDERGEEYMVPDLVVVAHGGRAFPLAFMPRPTYYVLPPADLLMFRRGTTNCVARASDVLSRIGGIFSPMMNYAELRASSETTLFEQMDDWDAALDSVALAYPPADLARVALDGFIDE